MADTYTLISSVTVGAGGASSIDFTSIPSTYTDLKLVLSARSTAAVAIDYATYSYNGSGSSKTSKRIQGNGSAASSQSFTDFYIPVTGASGTASTFSNTEIYIPNYAGSNYKSNSADEVQEQNGTAAYIEMWANLWSNTAAINQITLSLSNFAQYSTAYLYGIKNS